MSTKTPNRIILEDVEHIFVSDKPNSDMCFKCSLKELCETKIPIDSNNVGICNIFYDNYTTNGHFEIKS